MDAEVKASPPEPAPLERPGPRDEVVSYLRIDFHRCVIRRGKKVKTSKPLEAR